MNESERILRLAVEPRRRHVSHVGLVIISSEAFLTFQRSNLCQGDCDSIPKASGKQTLMRECREAAGLQIVPFIQ
jgi:hypothetical protein